MDLTPVLGGIAAVNLAVLLAGCALAGVRTYRERRQTAPRARFAPPVGTSDRRPHPAGRSPS